MGAGCLAGVNHQSRLDYKGKKELGGKGEPFEGDLGRERLEKEERAGLELHAFLRQGLIR